MWRAKEEEEKNQSEKTNENEEIIGNGMCSLSVSVCVFVYNICDV